VAARPCWCCRRLRGVHMMQGMRVCRPWDGWVGRRGAGVCAVGARKRGAEPPCEVDTGRPQAPAKSFSPASPPSHHPPAHFVFAGVSPGDRIVSVDGLPIGGKPSCLLPPPSLPPDATLF
jgi:hypothetical protein